MCLSQKQIPTCIKSLTVPTKSNGFDSDGLLADVVVCGDLKKAITKLKSFQALIGDTKTNNCCLNGYNH